MRPTLSTSAVLTVLSFTALVPSGGCGAREEAASSAESRHSAAPANQGKPVRTGRVAINGVDYYYEIHGQGEPLLLLHGGLGSIDMFGPCCRRSPRAAQVIAVDLHGHGRTPLGDRKISLIDIGDDMAVILDAARLRARSTCSATRWAAASRSGSRCSIPTQVRRLVLVSAGFAQDGFYPEMLPMQAQVGAGDGADDEGHADVQVVRRGRAEPGRVPEAARPHGRADAQAVRLGRGREEAARCR